MVLHEIAEILRKYINNPVGPVKWLPIAALVLLIVEAPNLSRFYIEQKDRQSQELTRQQYMRQLQIGYRHRLISGILLGLLSGA